MPPDAEMGLYYKLHPPPGPIERHGFYFNLGFWLDLPAPGRVRVRARGTGWGEGWGVGEKEGPKAHFTCQWQSLAFAKMEFY